MSKSIYLVFLFLFLGNACLFGQVNIVDYSFMNSYQKTQGSARIQAMGGAQTALGGDLSSIAGNPAGLGFFRSSVFSFGMNLGFKEASTNYLGTKSNMSNTPFSFDQIGVVLASPVDDRAQADWRGHSFGISYQKRNSFDQKISFNGLNAENDIINFYIEDDKFGGDYGDAAYRAYLIDRYDEYQNGNLINEDVPNRILPHHSPNDTSVTEQVGRISSKGANHQWSFAYGGNYKDKVFLGASLGVVTSFYEKSTEYSEYYSNGELFDHTLNENYILRGTGVNLNLGVIYKPNNQLNLGFSFTSPTIIGFEEESDFEMISYFENLSLTPGESFENLDDDTELVRKNTGSAEYIDEEEVLSQSPLYVSRWTLYTPLRLNFGAAYFFGKRGFLSADLEWVNYKAMGISSSDYSDEYVDELNDAIDEVYQSVLNFRIGGEYRLNAFRLRAGYSYNGNPIQSNAIHHEKSTADYTFGIGYRQKSWSVDLTSILLEKRNAYDTPYSFSGESEYIAPEAFSKIKEWQLSLSTSFYF